MADDIDPRWNAYLGQQGSADQTPGPNNGIDPRWSAYLKPPAPAEAPKEEEPLGPFEAGMKSAGADLRTAGAAIAQHLFNAPETAQELLSEANKTRDEVGRRYKPKVPSYTDIGKEGGIGNFLSDLGQYAYETGAQSLPQMGATLAGGAGGFLVGGPPGAIVGGAATSFPFFLGQNIEEQIKEGTSLPGTNLGVAAATAGVQGALDTLVGKVLPGVGKAAAGNAIIRALKKGLEGGAIEGLTEGAQQALQIGQANPTKLFDFGPEVQHELANAAIAGGLLGGTIGGGSGALHRRTPSKASDLPVQEDLTQEGMGPPPPDPWRPEGTGAPVNPQTEVPWQAQPEAMFPEGDTAINPYGPNPVGWEPNDRGLPKDQQTEPPFEPDTSVMFPSAGFFRTGQQVYKDVQQKLLAAGQKPMEANANAAIMRARYETLGKQLGTDAWTAYQSQNLNIKGPAPQTEGRGGEGRSYNQDESIDPQHYSLAQAALNRTPMKQGNAQQWLNALKKQGVKDEELEWTGYKDWLDEQKGPITKDQAIANFKPYGVGVYEAKPVDQGKQSYANWTLGGYGADPDSNYREVIVSDESQPAGTYESGHWPKVPNPLGHYRTTDRVTADGAPVLLAEEFQSDWHQKGREKGYITPDILEKQAQLDVKGQEILGRINNLTPQQDPRGVERLRLWEELDALDAQANEIANQAARGVKAAPFQQSWPNLIFRQGLMDAIRQGKDYFAWNTGDSMPEIEGWGSNPDPKKVEAMRQFYDGRIVDYANKLLKPYGGRVEKIDVSNGHDGVNFFNPINGQLRAETRTRANMMLRSAEEFVSSNEEDPFYADQVDQARDLADNIRKALAEQSSPSQAHAVKITDQMRELIGGGGLPLFQRQKGTPQGNITITPEQTTIRLFKTANASTFMHEAGHQFLEELHRYAPENKNIAADLTTFRQWLGKEVDDNSPLTTKQHEQFARGFEQYLRTGQAPTKGLQGIFEQFKQWLVKIYRQAMDLKVEVPPHIAEAYGRLLNQHDEIPTGKKIKSKLPAGVLYNMPEPGPMPAGQASAGRTYSQSGRANVDDLRPNMLRSNDNVNDRTWTPEFYFRMAKTEGDYVKHYEEQMRYWRNYHDTALRNRPNNSTRSRRTALENLEGARADAEKHRAQQKEYLAKADALNSRTFEQSPVENPSSIYSNAQKAGETLWGKTKAFFDPFSNISNKNAYLDERNLAMGGVGTAARAATDAKSIFDGLSNTDKDKAFEFFKTAGADPKIMPETIRSKAVALKNFINGPLKQDLIRNNLLSEDAANKQSDAYLPRLYLEHLVEGGGLANSFRLNRAYAKQKNSSKTADELVARGEIKDPGIAAHHAVFRTMRDLSIMNFMNKIAENPEWSFKPGLTEWNGRKVTPHWLKTEADHIIEKRAPAESNPERRKAMIDMAGKMREQATEGLIALDKADYDPKEWSQLPNTTDFGPLRGMIVRKQIAEDLKGTQNFVNENNPWSRWFGDSGSILSKGTGHWKALKVPMNPPSIVRNVVSNFLLANILGGVRIDRVGPVFIQAAHEMRTNGPYYRIAQKYGIGQSTFSEQELRSIQDDLKKIGTQDRSGFKAWRHLTDGFMKLEKFAGDKYQKMEEWGKLAVIIDAMKNRGMKENEAVRLANEALFDYSAVHPFIKGARQSPIGMPFLTFPAKAIPALAKAAVQHPTRFLPYVALAATVPAIVASHNDIGEDDAEKLRKSLGENLRRKKDMYLLPFKDANGRWQFADVGYFMPWQMPADVGRSLGQAGIAAVQGRGREATTNLADAFKSTSLLSNPLFNAVSAVTTGIDPFTGRPIADKRDPANKQVMDVMSYVWSLAVPSLFSGYGALGMLRDKEQGTGLNRYGEPTATYGQIAGRALGLNTYSVMPEEQRARNIKFMQRDIQDVRSRMSSALKDQSLTAEKRRSIAADFLDEIKDRTQELQRYMKESAPTERLRSATAR